MSALPASTERSPKLIAARSGRVSHWLKTGSEYLAWQVLTQLFTSLSGLIILRVETKSEFAFLTATYSAIVLFQFFSDMGIGTALRSMGGKLASDIPAYSSLLKSLIDMRRTLSIFAVVLLIPYCEYLFLRNGASITYSCLLCIETVLLVLPLFSTSLLRDTNLIMGKYRSVQLIEIASATIRLGGTALVAIVAPQTWAALVVIAIANAIQLAMYTRLTKAQFELSGVPDRQQTSRALRIVKNLSANSVFFALQGQLGLLIIATVSSANRFADLGAVSRIAALFGIVNVLFYNVFATRFARVPIRSTPTFFTATMGLAALLGLLMPAIVYALPGPFLWLLGPQYHGLRNECILAAGLCGVTTFNGALIALNNARAWLRVYSIFYIPTSVIAMAVAARICQMSTVFEVLEFGFAVPLVTSILGGLDAWIGMFRPSWQFST